MVIETVQDPVIVKALITAATLVITQVVKSADFVADRWIPLCAFVFSFCLAMFYSIDLLEAIILGGSASGLYDVVKQSVAGK